MWIGSSSELRYFGQLYEQVCLKFQLVSLFVRMYKLYHIVGLPKGEYYDQTANAFEFCARKRNGYGLEVVLRIRTES